MIPFHHQLTAAGRMILPITLIFAFFTSLYAEEIEGFVAPSLKGSFNLNQANISLWLSSAASCDANTYLTRKYKGPTDGFVPTLQIYHAKTDTNGYVGYLPSDSAIYVVFRGTKTIRNWIVDLDAFKTDYTTFPDCNCQVHKGFYAAEQAVIADVVKEVSRLKSQFPNYSVKVTGHSLGAALAQLASMDLVKAGYSASVYNFGQPRTGDINYASFATAKVPTWRVVHNRDTVPHLPFTEKMEFYHVCTEEFEDASGNLKTCNSSCEDPTCMNQYAFKETNTDDHLIYLGMSVSCSSVS